MKPEKSTTTSWLLFLLGLGAYPSVKLVGYMTITEFILIVIGPLVVLHKFQLLKNSKVQTFLWLALIWLLSAVASDLYRGTSFDQYARGWARVIMLGWSLLVMFCLLKPNPRLYVYFVAGISLSAIIVLYWGKIGRADYEMTSGQQWENTWETTYIYVAFNFCMLFAGAFWGKAPRTTAFFMILVGCFNVFMGSRALGAIIIMGAVTACVLRFNRSAQDLLQQHMTWRGLSVFAAVAGLFAWLILECYVILAAGGYLAEQSQQKYITQSQGPYGVIIGGRSNVVGAGLALVDSPVVGYGSWAEDSTGYYYRALELVGYDPRAIAESAQLFGNRIPTHSYLLEAWVEHGFFAACFWFYTLWFLVGLVKRSPLIDPVLLALVCVQFWLFLWNIFFSPMGGRPEIGAALAALVCLVEQGGSRTTIPSGRGPSCRIPCLARKTNKSLHPARS